MATAARFLLPLALLLVLSEAHGYHFIGCYRDTGNRDMSVWAASGAMSIGKCNLLCLGRQFRYFGLQATNECWCSNSYGKYGAAPNGECNMRCTGQSSEICGAGWRNSIYSSDYAPGLPIRTGIAGKVLSMTVPMPDGVVCSNCLISSFRHENRQYRSDNIRLNELRGMMSHYPAKARDKINSLRFGANAKTTFEDSSINIGPNHATKSTYFGVAERSNDQIRIGMMSTEIIATLVHKYNEFQRRVCRKIIFWKKCKTHTIRERRGYHGNEIQQIDTALQSEMMRSFSENIGNIHV